jgi:hypothetical protein
VLNRQPATSYTLLSEAALPVSPSSLVVLKRLENHAKTTSTEPTIR